MTLSQEERLQLLELYKDLRVADVRDGMDWLMMHHYGSMSPDKYTEWSAWYYAEVCTYPWMDDVDAGDFIFIDQSGVDVGLMGSNNSLGGVRAGARGYVTNGSARDTDEIVLQKIPFWCKFASQKMDQGRLQFDAQDVPVAVSGVIVYPGDVVVGDGDGVIVAPYKIAVDVAKYAHRELASDKASRRELYEQMGMELDDTVL